MKKSTRTLIIVAGALILAGALVYGAAYALGARPGKVLDSGALQFGGYFGTDRDDSANWGERYESDGEYSVDAEGISSLRIEWIAGETLIEAYDGNSVEFSEASNEKLTSNNALRYEIEDGELKIYYCKSGAFDMPEKKLRVSVPHAMAENMNALEYDSTSASLTVAGFTADSFSFSGVSGGLFAENMKTASAVLHSTSGDINFSGEYSELDADAISGEVTIESLGRARETDVGTTSGEITLSGDCGETSAESISGSIRSEGAMTAREFDADSSSGEIDLSFGKCPDKFDAETISGEVNVALPADSGFTVRFDTVSGEFNCDFSVVMSRNSFVCGDGASQFDVSTTSGSFNLKTVKE